MKKYGMILNTLMRKMKQNKGLKMDEQKQIDLLREALAGAVVTLTEVYKYAHMDSRTLQMVTDAMDEAESTLQLTDPH